MNNDDFLGNIALLTQTLQSFKQNNDQTEEGGVDLTGISDIEENDEKSDNEEPEDSEEEDPHVHEEFKKDVKELARIEDMITEYNTLIRELKKKKDQLRKKTITHMVQFQLDVAKMKTDGSDRFNLVKANSKISPTTKKRLPIKLSDYFQKEEKMNEKESMEKAKKIVDWIFKNADTTVRHSLRRYRKKSK